MKTCKQCLEDYESGHGRLCKRCYAQKSLQYYYETYFTGQCRQCHSLVKIRKDTQMCRICTNILPFEEGA